MPNPLYPTGSYYEPSRSVVSEMSRQLDHWRSLLPNPLKWFDDQNEERPNATEHHSAHDPLFSPISQQPSSSSSAASSSSRGPVQNWDILIAALRSRYLYVRFMIYLPYVYKALSVPEEVKEEDVEYCVICLRVGPRT